MKTLFTTLILFLCISCQKPSYNNFSINRDISIHRVSCSPADTSRHNIQFDLESLTNDEMQVHMRNNTFARWYVPNDTIWLLNEFVRGYSKKQRIYIISPDSAFVISVESAKLNNCTFHVKPQP